MVRIEVEGKCAWALVDSGADLSMISANFAHQALNKETVQKGNFGYVTSAGGGQVQVVGRAEVSFSLQAERFMQHMAVIPGLVYHVVLGRDFCCQHGTVLDDRAGIFKIRNTEIPLPTYEQISPHKARVLTCSQFSIPPRSEMLVEANLEPMDGGILLDKERVWQGVMEPEHDQEGRWLVPRILATVREGHTVPLKVVNASGHTVQIPQNTEMGVFYTVHENGDGFYEVVDQCDTNEKGNEVLPGEDMNRLLRIDEADVTVSGKKALSQLVVAYSDIFSKGDNDIGKTKLIQHHINTGDAKPVRQPPRRIPLRLRDEVERQKDQMLQDGIIEESSSPWCSPIVLARRKDGRPRFCIDLRAVNSVTQSLPHPLPRVDDALDSLAGSCFFSTLDMASGYWQVDLADEDKEKTAFTTGKGLHHFRSMPFGLKNAGATFQRLMELVLAGMDAKSCLVYIDDVIVFSKTEEAHLHHLEEVFKRIRQAGMKLKPKKCFLGRKEVTFLGHKVGQDGVQPDPSNITKVQDWPKPMKGDDLKSFLGLCGYYCRFIPGYSDLVKPLRDAAENKGSLVWSEEMSKSFSELKTKLVSNPILALPTFTGAFKVATDASNYSVGSVLTETIDGEDKVIAYASKVLSKTERRWPTYDKELWAIVWAIRHFRHYLIGDHFQILTDHKPLLNLPHSISVDADATGRRGRWAVELSSYDFTVTYRKGSENGNADAMSRIHTSGEEEVAEAGSEDPQAEVYLVSGSGLDLPTDEEMGEEMLAEQRNDDILKIVAEWVKKNRPPRMASLKNANAELRILARLFDHIVLENEVLKMRVCRGSTTFMRVLVPKTLRKKILELTHDEPTAGHLGESRTAKKILDRFYWPAVTKDVREYCTSCPACQRRSRPNPHMEAGLRTEVASRPFERLAIDITEMPLSSRGNKYALVLMDYFSKFVYAFPMPDQTTETVAGNLLRVVMQQGVPERLHSDQGRQFESAVFGELCKRLGITKTRTSPYRPQSDGMVERFNRTLKDMISKYIKSDGSDWDERLAAVCFAYNTSKHSVTGYSPFFLAHGREARLPVDEVFQLRRQASDVKSYVEHELKTLREAFADAREKMLKSAENMCQRQEESRKEADYLPGQEVWVTDPTAHAGGKRKLGMFYKGPGTVVGHVGPPSESVVYKIKMADGREVNVHHNRLKPVKIRRDEPRRFRPSDADSPKPTEKEMSRTSLPGVVDVTNETQRAKREQSVDVKAATNTFPLLFSDLSTDRESYVNRYGRICRKTNRYQAQ